MARLYGSTMNAILRVLLLGMIATSVGCTTVGLRAIPFTVASQSFENGDSLIVEQVLSSSPELRLGDKVVIRGRYRLDSRPMAVLGLHITTTEQIGPTPVSPKQRMEVASGTGTFELEHEIAYPGSLHVSFYGHPYGSSFGGVYFGRIQP
jgi:hypothetical protein